MVVVRGQEGMYISAFPPAYRPQVHLDLKEARDEQLPCAHFVSFISAISDSDSMGFDPNYFLLLRT